MGQAEIKMIDNDNWNTKPNKKRKQSIFHFHSCITEKNPTTSTTETSGPKNSIKSPILKNNNNYYSFFSNVLLHYSFTQHFLYYFMQENLLVFIFVSNKVPAKTIIHSLLLTKILVF